MTKLVFLLIMAASVNVFSQDSLKVGETFVLPKLNYPMCMRMGEEWTERAFEEEYAQTFDSIAQFLKANAQARFEIRMHTASRGTDSSNLILSQRRADDWLQRVVKHGVNAQQVTAIGIGEMFPRKVWVKDTVYYTDFPGDAGAIPVVLTDEYINSFRRTDRKRFELLHSLNRRGELVVSSIDQTAQDRINREIYLQRLYKDYQVVVIGSGTIEKNDTLKIENHGDLHFHLVAAGTENEFTIRSLEREEVYTHNMFISGKEELLDMSKAAGGYEIELFGDGGMGKMIIEIVNNVK